MSVAAPTLYQENAFEGGERWDVFPALPPQPTSILDVGCGFGHGFQTYRQRGARLVGVDNDPTMVAAAAKRLDEALVLDIERDPWPKHFHNAFDVIAFCDCLEHLIDPWQVLRSVRPLLSERGVVVASIPNVRQWRIVVKLALGKWHYADSAGTVQRAHVRFFARNTITTMFAEAGYQDPRYFFPKKTFHLRGPERVVNDLTGSALVDLLYGSYTLSARPK